MHGISNLILVLISDQSPRQSDIAQHMRIVGAH